MRTLLSETGIVTLFALALIGGCAVTVEEPGGSPQGVGNRAGKDPGTGGQSGVSGQGGTVGGTGGIGGTSGDGGAFGSGGAGGSDPAGGSSGVGGTTGVGGGDPAGGSAGVGGSDPAGGSAGIGGSDPAGGSAGVGGSDPAGGSAGVGGSDPAGGSAGVGGSDPTGGTAGVGGSAGVGGGGAAGSAGAGGSGAGGAGGSSGGGTCCPSGDCLCHGPAPTGLTSRDGPFRIATQRADTGTIHYPTNADPPFAGIAICPGFTNTGPEMRPWGEFYASWGIVTMVTNTGGGDLPDVRARKLLAAVAELKEENTRSGSPLFGKMSNRYGTSGYSMGGGGTTLASRSDASLKTSVGLAAWAPNGSTVRVPTLLLCGSSDAIAPCSGSTSAYNQIPSATPKMLVTVPLASHLSWFGPTNAGGGISGETALAFQKVFLEGDERWRPFLLKSRGDVETNIQ